MKVFTFYSNRFDSATTSIALHENGLDHNVLVHNEEQADNFRKHDTVRGNVIVTGKPRGLTYQRNAALELMDHGEWAAFLCDDFKEVLSLPAEWIRAKDLKIPITIENQNAFGFTKDHVISLKEMFSHFPMLIDVAEANRIHLIGFKLHDNPLGLGSKFTHRGLADGRFWLVKKSHYRFDENVQMIDDVQWTAENLVRHRNVLILNWILPHFKRYTAGGFGSIKERLEQRRRESAYLARRYGPLVRIAKKPGWPAGTHIRIYGTDKYIEQVRRRMRIL